MHPLINKSNDRLEKSLEEHTRKFLRYILENHSDMKVYLKAAASVLNLPMRRIYDITNALEGFGLIVKNKTNEITWKSKSVYHLE